jgi:hypothetical protein
MPFLAITSVIAAVCSHQYWMRLGDSTTDWGRRFWPWAIQGLLFPSLVFAIFNFGFGDNLPALVPEIVEAQRAGAPWLRLWALWSLAGTALVTFHWAAVTYIWMLFRTIQQSEDRVETLLVSGFFALFSFTVAGFFVYLSGWIYLGPGICLALLPIVHFTIEMGEKPITYAFYGKAIAHLKRGNVQDAEWEVISQLEKSENDFEGWMLLAEMYAKDYRNMEDAARVILDVCKQPDVQPIQVSIACHKLADWQLEIAENPVGARAALELLCRKLPGTHFAFMAQQRIRQIPSTCEEFDEAKKGRKIRLQPLREENDKPQKAEPVSRSEAAAEANRLSDKLSAEPNDIPAREKLALVLGEKLGKIDMAVEQLTLLGELPDATEEQKAKWLAQIASWEFNRDKDPEKFQTALRRIIREYPQTSHAFAAQRRLYLLEMNFIEEQRVTAPIPELKVS